MDATLAKPSAVGVREVMTARVQTLGMDNSIHEAARLFEREHFHHVVILERGRIFGVISDRDILKTLSPFLGQVTLERPQDVATKRKPIHQIMTRKPVTISVNASASEAARMMLSERVSCLPVVNDEGKLVGIVSMRDLIVQVAGPRPAAA